MTPRQHMRAVTRAEAGEGTGARTLRGGGGGGMGNMDYVGDGSIKQIFLF